MCVRMYVHVCALVYEHEKARVKCQVYFSIAVHLLPSRPGFSLKLKLTIFSEADYSMNLWDLPGLFANTGVTDMHRSYGLLLYGC